MTTTILTDDQIDEALESIGPDWWDVSPGADRLYARAIEQAVLQSDEIQALRKDLGMMRAAVRILSSAVELFAGELGADLGESKVSVTTNGDELAAVSIRDVIHKARASMEKQP